MPLHNQVRSLQAITLQEVAHTVVTTCISIKMRYGDYGEEACKKKVCELQMYLVSTLGCVMDSVSEAVKSEYIDLFDDLEDSRILYAVLIHEGMRKFRLGKYCQLWMIPLKLGARDYDCSLDTLSDYAFWHNQFGKLQCIVELNICCLEHGRWDNPHGNDLFKELSNNCKNSLKKICFNSHSCCLASDLGYLRACQELLYVRIKGRPIILPDDIRELSSVTQFIESLPKLEVFLLDLSNILDSYQRLRLPCFHSSSLRHIALNETVSNSQLMCGILDCCPNIQDLTLIRSFQTSQVSECHFLKSVANSQLQLMSLKVEKYPFLDDMQYLLRNKGTFLKVLSITSFPGLDIEIMMKIFLLIGQSCPSLTILKTNIVAKVSESSRDQLLGIVHTDTKIEIFGKLSYLKVTGNHCSNNYENGNRKIFSLLLGNAKNITRVKLFDIFNEGNDILTQLLQINPFARLEELVINVDQGQPCSGLTIRQLLERSPKLSRLVLRCPLDHSARTFLQELQSQEGFKNLEIDLDDLYEEPESDD